MTRRLRSAFTEHFLGGTVRDRLENALPEHKTWEKRMDGEGSIDVLFAGVGGQGIILASEVLAMLGLEAGCDVKQSEVHGMAQRGGSVTSHVRIGRRVSSPTIEHGRAGYLVSFEMLEALRFVSYLRDDGTAFVNTQRIAPITVSTGAAEYPEDIEDKIRGRCSRVVFVDGLEIAQAAGSIRSVNVAMLGALSTHLPYEVDLWRQCIRKRVPEKTLEVNMAAFEAGRSAAATGG